MADLSRWFYLALAVPGYGSYLEGATAGSCPEETFVSLAFLRPVLDVKQSVQRLRGASAFDICSTAVGSCSTPKVHIALPQAEYAQSEYIDRRS